MLQCKYSNYICFELNRVQFSLALRIYEMGPIKNFIFPYVLQDSLQFFFSNMYVMYAMILTYTYTKENSKTYNGSFIFFSRN